MRWDNLFDDLEGQLAQELSAEDLDLQAEEERLRLGRLTVRDRLVALHEARDGVAGSRIRVILTGGDTITIRPLTIGRDWISADLVGNGMREEQCVLPLTAVAALILSPEQSAVSLAEGESPQAALPLVARISLAFVLRDLCRRRAAVELRTTVGPVHGTIDRVGRDHLDIAVHEPGQQRRAATVTQLRLVPFSDLLLVRVV